MACGKRSTVKKPVEKLDVFGQVIGRYDSLTAAADANHFSISGMERRVRRQAALRNEDGSYYRYKGAGTNGKLSDATGSIHS